VAARITNAFTCDVEDYFQVSALAPHFPREQWDSVPCRVERNVDRILALLDGHGARAAPSSPWAGSPSAIPAWCAASPPRATRWRATATRTSARAI
jgi:hypothetical protein